MAGLLVSVRSAEEALAAVTGGASIVDIKEPSRGPLGRASPETWRAVHSAVKGRARLSVALGELVDFDSTTIPSNAWDGIDYRKIGPAYLGDRWATRWLDLLNQQGNVPPWVAVIYADWEAAAAPSPETIIEASLQTPSCCGILVDSWDKRASCPIQSLNEWYPRIARIRAAGRFVALAGRLDETEIHRLRELEPDLFAVRSAACVDRDRDGLVVASRVARLVEATGRPFDALAGQKPAAVRF